MTSSSSAQPQLLCRLDNMQTTSLSGGTVTKLLVTGIAGLEDLWRVFSTFGEISNISMEGRGEAKVTFKNDESLDAFQVSGELHVGDFILMVTKIKERKEQVSPETPHQQADWSYQSQRSFLSRPPPPPPPLYGMMYLQNGSSYPYSLPLPLYHYPPPSPHYDTAILDLGPEQTQSQYYNYPTPPPPITPCPSPSSTPQYLSSASSTFFLPPSPAPSSSTSSLTTLSGTTFIPEDHSLDDQVGVPRPATPAPVMKADLTTTCSPFKTFTKFTGKPVRPHFPLKQVKPSPAGSRREKKPARKAPGGDGGTEPEQASWYQAGDRWGHRRWRSKSFCEADAKPENCDIVVGSKKGIPVVQPGAKMVYRSKLTTEPDILRDVGSLALD